MLRRSCVRYCFDVVLAPHGSIGYDESLDETVRNCHAPEEASSSYPSPRRFFRLEHTRASTSRRSLLANWQVCLFRLFPSGWMHGRENFDAALTRCWFATGRPGTTRRREVSRHASTCTRGDWRRTRLRGVVRQLLCPGIIAWLRFSFRLAWVHPSIGKFTKSHTRESYPPSWRTGYRRPYESVLRLALRVRRASFLRVSSVSWPCSTLKPIDRRLRSSYPASGLAQVEFLAE